MLNVFKPLFYLFYKKNVIQPLTKRLTLHIVVQPETERHTESWFPLYYVNQKIIKNSKIIYIFDL